MNGFLGRLQGKLQEARISDVNHELGKVKESLVTESSAYWHSFRSEAASVGSLIRSESTNRFSQIWTGRRDSASGEGAGTVARPAAIPKSVSLPAIAPIPAARSHKYKYKSSAGGSGRGEEAAGTGEPLVDEETADSFIKVLEKKVEAAREDDEDALDKALRHRRGNASTREEIRKKLALFGSVEEEEEEDTQRPRREGGDLEVCFINEAVADEEEEQEDSRARPREDSPEKQGDERAPVPSLKGLADWQSVASSSQGAPVDDASKEERARATLRKRLAQLHQELQASLSECRRAAGSQVERERARRRREDPLKPLVGLAVHEVTGARLGGCGVSALQVVAEHFHAEIERLNEELVRLLLEKDELEIEQDSQLLDVEDLSHSLSKL